MSALSRSIQAYASITPARRRNLIARLLERDAHHRQMRALGRLDAHLRRDIGLEDTETQRDPRGVAWNPPEWWR
jgi:hypothetical protein